MKNFFSSSVIFKPNKEEEKMESSSDECSYDGLYRRLFKSKEEEEEDVNLGWDGPQPDQSSSLEIDDVDADVDLLSSSSPSSSSFSFEEDKDASSSSTTTGESEISPNEDAHTDDGPRPSSSSSSTRRARQAKKLEKDPTIERFLHECCVFKGQEGFDEKKVVCGTAIQAKFDEWRRENLGLPFPHQATYKNMKYLSPYLRDFHLAGPNHKRLGEAYPIHFRDKTSLGHLNTTKEERKEN